MIGINHEQTEKMLYIIDESKDSLNISRHFLQKKGQNSIMMHTLPNSHLKILHWFLN